MSGMLPGPFCGRRRSRKQPTHVQVESLEPRRLYSASLGGAFTGALPAMLLTEEKTSINFRLTNTGDARTAGIVKIDVFASKIAGVDAANVLLGDASKPLHLKPKAAANLHLRLSPPATLRDGNYYLVATVDAAASAGTTTGAVIASPRTIPVRRQFVNLTGQIVSQPNGPLIAGGRQRVGKAMVLVFNQGNAPARGPLSITFYASADGVLDVNDPAVAAVHARNAGIPAGSSKLFSANVILPPGMQAGNYRLFAAISPSRSNGANPTLTLSATSLVVAGDPPVIDLRQHNRHDDDNSGAGGDDDSIEIGSDIGGGSDDGGTDPGLPSSDGSADNAPPSDSSGGNDTTTQPAPPDSTPPDVAPPDNTPPDNTPPPDSTPADPGNSGDSSGSSDSGGSDFTQDPSASSGGGGGADF
jgi:hypothetical protein